MSIAFPYRVHYCYGSQEVLLGLLFPKKSESSNRLVSDLFAAKEGNDSTILECDFREAQVKTSCLNVMRNLNFEPKAVILIFITL